MKANKSRSELCDCDARPYPHEPGSVLTCIWNEDDEEDAHREQLVQRHVERIAKLERLQAGY